MISRLEEEHPEIAARFREASARLARFEDYSASAAFDALGQISPERAAAEQARNRIVYEIRALEGFTSFAQAADWQEISKVAETAPLVYMVLTHKGLAALGVRRSGENTSTATAVVEDVTLQEVIASAMPFFEAEFGTGQGDRMVTLEVFLNWLCGHVTPILQRMRNELKADTHIFLQPVGSLSSLAPLNLESVVGKDGRTELRPQQMNHFYWARGLAQSLARRKERPASGALVINNPLPLPVVFDSLELGDAETQVVFSHMPGIELKGEAATSDAVLDALPNASLAHFCCHGTVDRRFLYTGILILADNQILLYKQLRDCPALKARLVVLSACRSGSAVLQIDPALSLPACFSLRERRRCWEPSGTRTRWRRCL